MKEYIVYFQSVVGMWEFYNGSLSVYAESDMDAEDKGRDKICKNLGRGRHDWIITKIERG